MNQVFLGKCDDEIIHGFHAQEDGAVSQTPLCGANVLVLEAGDDEEVCESCIPLIEEQLGLPHGTFDNEMADGVDV